MARRLLSSITALAAMALAAAAGTVRADDAGDWLKDRQAHFFAYQAAHAVFRRP